MSRDFSVCTKCICDNTIPSIRFDDNGVCTFCHTHNNLEKRYPLNREGKQKLEKLVDEIIKEGKNKEYDCVVGVSGGRDSTYTLLLLKKQGLRPLAVHFDNGWNSDIAVSNIKESTSRLGVDLYTVVADWEEFKDLQKSFLKASVSDAEIPTDYVIISVLFKTAADFGVKYVLNGHSFRTEGVVPREWTYMDGRYIRSVHKKYGKVKITSFPVMSLSKLLYYTFVKKLKYISFLQYFDYQQKIAMNILEQEVGWKYYGGHHHESIYTQFFQSFLLPEKFKIDKRKLELSALIRSGQISRQEALKEIQDNPYPYDKEVVKYTISKLGLTDQEFQEILISNIKTFHDYPTYYPLIRAASIPIRIACHLNFLPEIFVEKYLN